jgi:hypothetical protein
MKDKDFLKWIHARLANVHKEDECFTYMHKLRAIIAATDPNQETQNISTFNSLDELNKAEKVGAINQKELYK